MGEIRGSYNRGNNFNQQWTEESTIALFEEAIQLSEDHGFIIAVAREQGTYSELYLYLKKQFKDNEEIQELYKIFITSCEATMWVDGANGKKDKTMCIFALKSLHNRIETNKTELSGPGGKELSITPIQFFKTENEDK